MKRKPVIAGVIFVAVFLAVLLYSTMSLTRSRHRVEVCMQFDGRTNCRVASAQTKDLAFRAAVQNACALIAGGVTDSEACQRATPLSVKWLDPEN